MATQNRRATRSSSTKRPAAENGLKFTAVSSSQQAKRRAPLGNLTNQANSSKVSARSTTGTVGNQGRTGSTDSKVKKTAVTHVSDVSLFRNSAHTSSALKPVGVSTSKDNSLPRKDGQLSSFVSLIAPRSTTLSPSRSDGGSISLDETMSTCDSVKSPDFEYIDTGDASIVDSLERITCHNLYISKQSDAEIGTVWKSDILTGMEIDERKVINVDDNHVDTQLCAEYACDIYNHLRNAETKKRPAIDFMEGVQKDINASMRAILIDWLVEVAEEYRLIPDTLYLTVNYIDRYLSGNAMNRQRLQLLGVACMMIAAKYEEICAPQVEEFCFITDNTYFRDEVLQMESAVLKYLKFELTAPTVKCFLRRFVRAAQESTEVPSLQLEFLANYLAELSLLEYNLLCYSPSLIAASAIFLAKFILQHSKRPWNVTLRHYTQYQPSELCNCVKALQSLFCNSHNSTLPAIKEKYSQHKYKFVAKKYCPPSIPCEFFSDVSN